MSQESTPIPKETNGTLIQKFNAALQLLQTVSDKVGCLCCEHVQGPADGLCSLIFCEVTMTCACEACRATRATKVTGLKGSSMVSGEWSGQGGGCWKIADHSAGL